ncbi:MAG: alpha/beta fold hydrolase [Rubrivivax sp.]|nr:alpha/beta fold hydrolase [Rubrivivax sp.]
MRVRVRLLFLGVAALVSSVAAAWLASQFRADLARHEARLAAAGSRVVATRCGDVEVGEAGPAGAPALLVVHGSGGGFDQGLALGADLAARGWRVVAPSRFGYLRTPWPAELEPGSPAGALQADHLACLLDALGLDGVAVMGVSAGAIAAAEFAVRHAARTRALVLMVPAAYRPPAGETPAGQAGAKGSAGTAGPAGPAGMDSVAGPASAEAAPSLPGWAQALLEGLVSADAPYWLAARLAPGLVRRFVLATPASAYEAATPPERQRADRVMHEVLPISARRIGLLHDTAATQRVPRPTLERIGAPTLAICARDDGYDTCTPARYAARHIPGARLLAFERGGHLLLDRQADATAAIDALLRSVPVAR